MKWSDPALTDLQMFIARKDKLRSSRRDGLTVKKRTVRWESSDESNDEMVWAGHDKENKNVHAMSGRASNDEHLKTLKARNDGARGDILNLLGDFFVLRM